MLSSANDQLVPTFHMEQLYAKAKTTTVTGDRIQFVSFKIGSHNDIPIAEAEKYHDSILQFLIQHSVVTRNNVTLDTGNKIRFLSSPHDNL